MKKWACLLLIVFVFTLGFAGYKTFLSLSHPIKYQNEILKFATEYELSPAIIASVINVESGYNKNAISNKNAVGLMQLKLETAIYMANEFKTKENLSFNLLMDAKTNIKYGCIYLTYLIKKFNNIYTALAAYNAGETRVKVWLSDTNYSKNGQTLTNIPYKETANYINKIKSNLKFYNKVY